MPVFAQPTAADLDPTTPHEDNVFVEAEQGLDAPLGSADEDDDLAAALAASTVGHDDGAEHGDEPVVGSPESVGAGCSDGPRMTGAGNGQLAGGGAAGDALSDEALAALLASGEWGDQMV